MGTGSPKALLCSVLGLEEIPPKAGEDTGNILKQGYLEKRNRGKNIAREGLEMSPQNYQEFQFLDEEQTGKCVFSCNFLLRCLPNLSGFFPGQHTQGGHSLDLSSFADHYTAQRLKPRN